MYSGYHFEHARCCFTENALNRLFVKEVPFGQSRRSHFQIFGPFAVGIKNEHGRILGISPASYFYRASHASRAFSEDLIARLHEIRNSLVIMAEIESRGNPDHDVPKSGYALPRSRLASIGVDFHSELYENVRAARAKIDSLSPSEAKSFELMFTNKKKPFWYQVQQLTLLLHLFQVADSVRNERHLAYYRQREWRAIRFFHEDIHVVPLSDHDGYAGMMDENAKAHVTQFLNNWTNCMRSGAANTGVGGFDRCWLLIGRGERHVRDFISEVVVPREVEGRVRQFVQALEARKVLLPGRVKIRTYDAGEVFN